MEKLITRTAFAMRQFWIEEISKVSGDFESDTGILQEKLATEIKNRGSGGLLDHLRLCGDIPESYGHDSSEEKLYSKYTDCLLAETFNYLGLKSLVLRERADVADVEVFAKKFSFIADAKSFRLSRTAKNQKDFKVQAMHGWKRGKPYAMVVCPIYHLPNKSSQIYQQASAQNVCILTYSHLAVLVAYMDIEGSEKAESLIFEILKSISYMNPSKDATLYWSLINRAMLNFSGKIERFWLFEKQAVLESIALAKESALNFLSQEREKIMRLSHEEALLELVRVYKIENRIRAIQTIRDNHILEMR